MKKILVFGGGQVGSSVAKILSDDGNDITLVDYDRSVLNELKESIDIKTIHGLASYPSVQKIADAEKNLIQLKEYKTKLLGGLETIELLNSEENKTNPNQEPPGAGGAPTIEDIPSPDQPSTDS